MTWGLNSHSALCLAAGCSVYHRGPGARRVLRTQFSAVAASHHHLGYLSKINADANSTPDYLPRSPGVRYLKREGPHLLRHHWKGETQGGWYLGFGRSFPGSGLLTAYFMQKPATASF